MRRSPGMGYQSGFHAFPGGQLEKDENARQGAVRELEEETGVRITPEELVEAGRWVTPAFLPRRFDTQFFLARCPADQNPDVLTTEHDLGEWTTPAKGLSEWNQGRVLMAPPIRYTLLCLNEGLENIQNRLTA